MSLTAPARRPHRVTARTLLFGTSALLAAALLGWSPQATTGWNQASAEGTLWQLLNGARTNNGLAPLQHHGTLLGIARWRSSDMLARNYFSHTIPGCNCLVYAYYDQNGLNYTWAGENIGWNSGHSDDQSPIRVHEQFMGSPGHRANVLTAGFTHGAVGGAAADNKMYLGHVQNTRMYTELFMQSGAAAPPPAPAPARPASGGGSAPPPATAAPPAAAPAVATADDAGPEPMEVSVADAVTRPRSGAGLDGITELVLERSRVDVAARIAADDALGVDRLAEPEGEGTTVAASERAELEVQAASQAEPGFIDGVLGALFGFLFG